MEQVDEKDMRIIGLLTQDSRSSLRQIGRQVSLSPGAVRNRIRRLRDEGIIERFTVDVDWRRLGYDIQAVLLVTVRPGVTRTVYDTLLTCQDITRVYWTTGPATFVCVARFRNMADLSRFLTGDLERIDGVEKVETMFLIPPHEGTGESGAEGEI